MRIIMIATITGTFLINCYLLYLIHFRLRPILNSWAWFLIFTGYGCLFLMSGLGVYLAYDDPLPSLMKAIFCILMFAKGVFFAAGLSVLEYDLRAALKTEVWLHDPLKSYGV